VETLIIERSEGLLTVTMNRPAKRNAANSTMFEELLQIFREVEEDPAIRAMVLTGAGGAFCTGADLSDASGPIMDFDIPAISRMRRLGDVALALHAISKPTIAKVDGLAVGAGLSMALGCDLIIASERARFSAIFARRGLSLDFGISWLLPRAVGMPKAKELALLGEIIDAPEALAMGLINRVVPLEELDAAVNAWAQQLATGPTLALSMTKRLLNNSASASMYEALEDEGRTQAVNFSTADTIESVTAFLQKREPNYRAR